MISVKGKRVTVMGLGLHGGALGTVQWLLGHGAYVTITDLKTEAQLAPTLEKLAGQKVEFVLGQHRDEDFTDADLVVRNPGVPKNSPYLQKAREARVPIEMDSSLFFLNCPSKEIIGVTGSKGKTTATRAITAVLKAGGKKVIEVGTDGISPLGKLSEIDEDTIVVFELSSWRLEALEPHKLSPHIAVVTSIYNEHLNTYDSLDEYIETKKTIIRHQTEDDIAILNGDDDELRGWKTDVHGEVQWYSVADVPDYVLLLGEHQRRNLVPAIIIGKILEVSKDTVAQTISAIETLPHRLEKIASRNDITYINDSAATMPDATIAALEALQDKNLILILGGGDKNLEFAALAEQISRHPFICAIVWLPGAATEKMKQTLGSTTSPLQIDVGNMKEAVQEATRISGDTTHGEHGEHVILLSPAATSFGLFKHEFDRGDQFRQAVRRL